MYDLRKKAEIDYQWGLKAAKRKGREEGIKIGEALGEARGEARGIIKALQEILGIMIYSDEELYARSLEELGTIVAELRTQTLNRATGGDAI